MTFKCKKCGIIEELEYKGQRYCDICVDSPEAKEYLRDKPQTRDVCFSCGCEVNKAVKTALVPVICRECYESSEYSYLIDKDRIGVKYNGKHK